MRKAALITVAQGGSQRGCEQWKPHASGAGQCHDASLPWRIFGIKIFLICICLQTVMGSKLGLL
jgi:hypothetical protein